MTLRSQVNELSFLLKRNVLLDQNEVNMAVVSGGTSCLLWPCVTLRDTILTYKYGPEQCSKNSGAVTHK